MHGVERGLTFKDALLADQRVAARLSEQAIDALLDYRAHIGMIQQMVDRVLARAREERAGEAEKLYE